MASSRGFFRTTLTFAVAVLATGGVSTARAQWAGSQFYSITREDRVEVARELCKALEAKYSLWDLKKSRIGLDPVQACENFIKSESSVPDPADEPYAQAKANLLFFDRMRIFVASFQDSHFSTWATQMRAAITLPFSIARAEDKFVITATYPTLLKLIETEQAADGWQTHSSAGTYEAGAVADISPGDTVVLYNGQPPAEAARELVKYLNDSSPGIAQLDAVGMLTSRSSQPPESGRAQLRILSKKDGKMRDFIFPWFYKKAERADEKLYFEHNHYIATDLLNYEWDEEKDKWKLKELPVAGYRAYDIGANLKDLKEYKDAKGVVQVRTGIFVSRGFSTGVLQVLTFGETTLISADGQKLSFPGVLSKTISAFKTDELPLILDLRGNTGGYIGYSSVLLSLLSPKDAHYANIVESFRVTRYAREVIEDAATKSNFFGQQILGLTQDQLVDIFHTAVAHHDTYTAAFSGAAIEADEKVGGYDGKIVALIDPQCMSTCDLMAALLKSSHRATLLGQPTNGTGGGFSGDVTWHDPYDLASARFPNMLFGGPPAGTDQLLFPGKAEEFCSENQPVLPDLAYASTLQDYATRDAGWLKAAVAWLKAVPPKP